MPEFKGFTDNETFTKLPDTFFQQMLNDIDDIAELKVTLYFLWRVAHMESAFRYLCKSEIMEDDAFMAGLSAAELQRGLDKCVQRGSLLRVENDSGGFYFINSPRGRAAAEALRKGDWRASARIASLPLDRPNIFKLYEENIGPLTPLMADTLREAEGEYPSGWISEAFSIAVERNKRNWKYIEAILRRWKEEGKDERRNQQDTGEGSERYTKNKFSDYID